MKRDAALLIAWVSLFSLCFSSVNAASRIETSEPETIGKKFFFLPVPLVFYMPETRWAFGAATLFSYNPRGHSSKTRPSTLSLSGYTTQNRQYSIELQPEIYLENETYFIKGALRISRYPDRFFGIGDGTTADMEESYTSEFVKLDLSFQKKIHPGSGLYAGVGYKYEHHRMIEVMPGGIPGREGGTLSALGLILNWDTRDNIYFPRTGRLFQFTADVYAAVLGSEFDFTALKLDLRTYVPLAKSHSLAFQFLMDTRLGEPPFYSLSQLGGDRILRGYYTGRFRDKTAVILQGECRLQVLKKLGVVIFAGLGNVTDHPGNLNFRTLKYSLGIGLRFFLSPGETPCIRGDFGLGKKSSGLYFTVKDAF
ncbi:MAG: BamA/TamA family outer membrane protein [Candidatus Aminicenantes bacterium]|nr:BamA/TamA family outer membrane protein [Candidatus Aminicenantes bacterium]